MANEQPGGDAIQAVTHSGTAVNAEVLTVGPAVTARASQNPAVVAESPFAGVVAVSANGLGVSGVSQATTPYQQGDLVYPAGVYGKSPANVGVVGESAGDWAVLGRSQSATAGGLAGVAENAGGIGVRGDAVGGNGVLGVSIANGAGVVGRASMGTASRASLRPGRACRLDTAAGSGRGRSCGRRARGPGGVGYRQRRVRQCSERGYGGRRCHGPRLWRLRCLQRAGPVQRRRVRPQPDRSGGTRIREHRGGG